MADAERLDANLLVTLHALLTERNITRAAASLRTTSAAVGHALTRLRVQLNDDILIRTGRSFELSEVAIRLRPIVEAAVLEAERTWNLRRDFDPATSDRRFLISASDYAMTVLAEPLFELFETEAPGVSISFESLPVTTAGIDSVLMRRDVVIASNDRGIPGQRLTLFDDELVVVARHGHPDVVDGALSADGLRRVSFAISNLGPRFGLVDEMFTRAGIVPRVAVRVGGFGPIPWLITSNDLVSIMPRRLYQRHAQRLPIREVRSPLEPARMSEAAHFNPAVAEDAGVKWLLGALRRVPPAGEDPRPETPARS